jgi:hypothetical protein
MVWVWQDVNTNVVQFATARKKAALARAKPPIICYHTAPPIDQLHLQASYGARLRR